MIKVILRGGLGNQMFQYAAGLSLALKNKTELVLDTTFLNDRFPRRNFVHRAYDLDLFDIHSKFTKLSKISSVFPVPGFWLGLDLVSGLAGGLLGIRPMIREKEGGIFDPAIIVAGNNAVLWGFWQSERYFSDVAAEVRSVFRFRNQLSGDAAQIAKNMQEVNSVSLSVRRSDYTKSFHAKIFGETDMGYYDRAIAYIAEKVPSPHFFIFSDDIAWCKENIKPKFPTTYISEIMRGPRWSWALELSSRCKHQIIANSTFWWWAAWLNQNPDKIVIAPRCWFVGRDRDDVVPASWIRV